MNRFLVVRGLLATVVGLLACWSVPSARAQVVLVQPYVQPGDGRALTGSDVKVLRWLTDQTPGNFVVEYQTEGGPLRTAKAMRLALDFPKYKATSKKDTPKEPEKDSKETKEQKDKKDPKDTKGQKDTKDQEEPKQPKEPKVPPPPEKEQHYFRYTAQLEGLPFNSDVHYSVKLDGKVIRQATFRTRATADKSTRCVLVGDMAQGRTYQRPIAYQISLQKPEFLVALGDIVYSTGRVNQYMHFFWDTYNNVAEPGPKTGAPLMATVPFYPLLGNHDVGAKLPTVPDALAAYYFFAPPKGGPGPGPWVTQLGKDATIAEKFRAATTDSYPNLDAYSFDSGAAHFVVLNDNKTMQIEHPTFLKWLREDLTSTKATWKFVCFHIPGFQSSISHYPEQQIRPLQPLFEECGVTMTFAGHVHNYQRSVPLQFVPETKADKKGKVNGKFTLDHTFDGVKHTTPVGVIHIVAGGGGASLYGPGLEKTAPLLKKNYGDNYADFTAKMVVDRHSFVVLDIAPNLLELRAFSSTGKEIDRVTLTKK